MSNYDEKLIKKTNAKSDNVDRLDLVDRERINYNKGHGTNYSYGYYVAYKRLGLLDKNEKK